MAFVEMTFGFIQALFGFILVLFIPGYAITLVLYPQKKDISDLKRIGLSIVLSLISVMLLVLFIDEVLSFNTTPGNIIVAILIFSLLAVCICKGELLYNENIPKFLLKKKNMGENSFPVNISKFKTRSTPENTDVAENKPQKEENNDGL